VSGPDDLLRRSRAASLDPFMRHQVARFDARQEWRRREAERLAGDGLAAVPPGAARATRPHEEICRVTGNAITGIG